MVSVGRGQQTTRAKGTKGKATAKGATTSKSPAKKSPASTPAPEPAAGTTEPNATARRPREGSALHAALVILSDADTPLTPQEIYDRAAAKGLAGGLKGKTPVATLGAQLATANKRGHLFQRPTPGRYTLRDGVTA